MTKLIFLNGTSKAGNHLLFKVGGFFGCKYPEDFVEWKHIAKYVHMIREGTFFITNFKECFLVNHLGWSQENEDQLRSANVKMICIFRDPRDIATSFVRSIEAHLPNVAQYWSLIDEIGREEFLHRIIVNDELGARSHTSPEAITKFWLPWCQVDFCLETRFEKLIGTQGGGNDDIQLKELKRICEFIGSNQTDEWYRIHASKLYGQSNTFLPDVGLGKWKQYFTSQNVNDYKRVGQRLLEILGYENDINWGL